MSNTLFWLLCQIVLIFSDMMMVTHCRVLLFLQPEACKPLRDSLVAAKDDGCMYDILKNVKSWEYGKVGIIIVSTLI